MKKLQRIENIISNNEDETISQDLIKELSKSVTPFYYKIAVQESLQLIDAYVSGQE